MVGWKSWFYGKSRGSSERLGIVEVDFVGIWNSVRRKFRGESGLSEFLEEIVGIFLGRYSGFVLRVGE